MVTRERAGSGALDGIEIAFDDQALIADAGLILPATLCDRLGAKAVIDERVRRPGQRAGAGAKALSVSLGMLAGADCIDDIERLRAGAAGAVLGIDPAAATTAGGWLRGLGFGQVRQLDAAVAGCSPAPGAWGPDLSGW